jgi:hypothetical protein
MDGLGNKPYGRALTADVQSLEKIVSSLLG